MKFLRSNFQNQNYRNLCHLACVILVLCVLINNQTQVQSRLVVNTWAFTEANDEAWEILTSGGNALDAVESGCSKCEQLQCGGSVGFGSHPDETDRVTLDAMVFDGRTHKSGSVAALKSVKAAISVARKVLEHSQHSLLVGQSATRFAVQMGFPVERLETNESEAQFQQWKEANCQPNYWLQVSPDPNQNCGPYTPTTSMMTSKSGEMKFNTVNIKASAWNHDTIGMIAIDTQKNIAVGTSTNGMTHKFAGRVADTAIPGAGGYVDNEIGAAACTGDGDVIMRFAPAFHAVNLLSSGITPSGAAELALRRMSQKYPNNMAAIVVANAAGEYGAACFGAKQFPYCVRSETDSQVQVIQVECFQP